MTLVKVAVIGLGNMGRHHARHYAAMPQCEFVGVVDVRSDVANEFATTYGCRAYSTVANLLANEKVDAVSITVPTQHHFEVAVQVLNAGISVLIEKPIATTVSEGLQLVALAKEKNVTLMVGHIERFNPAVTQLKHWIQSGKLGQITSILARRLGTFPTQIKDANVVIDLAVHDIDVISYLLDSNPNKIVGNAGRALIEDREDYADILLSYAQTSAVVQVSWISPVRIRALSVSGTQGYAELNYMTQSLSFYPSSISKQSDQHGNIAIAIEKAEPQDIEIEKGDQLRLELAHFLDCVASHRQPLVSGEVGVAALEHALQVLSLWQ